MGFFSDSKPRVTKDEFIKVRSELVSHGFTTKELNELEEIFRGDMYEEREMDAGIDEFEIDNAISWMRNHTDIHHMSPEKINIIETKLKERLKRY